MLVPGEDQTAALPMGLVLPSGLEWSILKWTACEAQSSEGRRGALRLRFQLKPVYLGRPLPSLWLGSGSPLALPFHVPKCPEPFPGQLLPQDVGVWLAAISTTSPLGTIQARG